MTISGIGDAFIGAVNNYKISNSLKFTSGKLSYLSQNINSSGNRKTFTFSTWLKRGLIIGGAFSLFDNGKWDVGPSQSNIRIAGNYDAPTGSLEILEWNGSIQWRVITILNLLLDTSAWQHVLVAVDTTQTVAANRVKIYVNGYLQTEFYTATYPALNAETYFNSGIAASRTIGSTNSLLIENYDGLLSETYWVDGQALQPSAFGVFSDTGTLIPRKYSGTVGATGFYLNYSNTSNIQNLITYSENFQSAAGWNIASNTGRIANSGANPVGANTATKIVESSSADGSVDHYIFRTIAAATIANNTQHTWSWYAKAQEVSTLQSFVQASIAGGTDIFMNMDLANGTVTKVDGNANSSGNMQYVGNDWWRCSVTFTSANVSAAGSVQFRLVQPGTSGTTNFTGDGISGALIWGTQLNTGNTAHPYLFTTNTAINSALGLGIDSSSVGVNSFTPINFEVSSNVFATDITNDSPTDYADGALGRGNYCQLNTNDTNVNNGITYAGTKIDAAASNSSIEACGTIAIPTSGKWYWEVQVANSPVSGINIGICYSTSSGANPTDLFTNPRIIYINDGKLLFDGGAAGTNATGLATASNNDVIGVAVDTSTGNIAFYKNNTLILSRISSTITALEFKPLVEVYSNCAAYANFGRTNFTYTPPAGYLAINTSNLPSPTITRPKKYFDVRTWTGDGQSTRSITGLEFPPSLVIIKKRSANNYWNVYDSVRGANNVIFTNQPAGGASSVEILNNGSGWVNAFNSDGFTLDYGSTGLDVNENNANYISYIWNEDVAAGLDIVSWTGNGVNNRGIAHGLGVQPNLVIAKSRTSNTFWRIYSSQVTPGYNTSFQYGDQYQVSATADGGISSANSTAFVLSQGTTNINAVNQNLIPYIGYAFSSVAGYSKFGVYQSNGSQNGPFIYTGFKPAVVMIKGLVVGGSAFTEWVVYNSKSDRDSVEGKYELLMSTNSSESVSGTDIWTFANGFKTANWPLLNNALGNYYLYAAWASVPFKFARGR